MNAFVTLATNDQYASGALVVGGSLRKVQTKHQIVCMITRGVTEYMRHNLSVIFDEVIDVTLINSNDSDRLLLLGRPELGLTFTKLQCWNLTQYDKCVFLDADTLAVQNVDELFEREEFSAASDTGWPDCFNSGVFVFKPSKDTYSKLVTFATEHGSFDGADQGLLNSYFSDWAHSDIRKHLPFIYNVTPSAFYSYLPAYRRFQPQIKIYHFIGADKPWGKSSLPGNTPNELSVDDHVVKWWFIMTEYVIPLIKSRLPRNDSDGGLPSDSQISPTQYIDSTQLERPANIKPADSKPTEQTQSDSGEPAAAASQSTPPVVEAAVPRIPVPPFYPLGYPGDEENLRYLKHLEAYNKQQQGLLSADSAAYLIKQLNLEERNPPTAVSTTLKPIDKPASTTEPISATTSDRSVRPKLPRPKRSSLKKDTNE